jgi:D-glycero-alpha-D-manno-heptose-7-phosphate kinase
VTLTAERKQALGDRLLLFFLGTESSAQDVLREQQRNVARNGPALRELRGQVDEAQGMLGGAGDLDAFGRLLHDAWRHKRSLSTGITNSTIDAAYDAARQAGAIGGKLLGAGGRGFLVLYADPAAHAAVRTALSGLTEIPFEFGDEGSRIIFRPSDA